MSQSQSDGSPEQLKVDEIWHLREPANDQPDPSQRSRVGINAYATTMSLLKKATSNSEDDEASSSSANKDVVRVVLYDLGVEYHHPGLEGRIDLERSRDFDHSLNPGGLRPPTGLIEDRFDAHGTACAGLVCGRRDPGRITNIEEDKQFIGVAPMCQVVSVRISTNFDLDSLIAALNYAKEAGDVILLPRALPEHQDLTTVLKEIAAEVPVVCASGNDGRSSLAYPASVDNVIAVGACNDKGYRSTYSQYGQGLTLVAPSDDEQCEHEDLVRLSQEEAEERLEEAVQVAEETQHRAERASYQAEQARQRTEREQAWTRAERGWARAEQAWLRVKLASLRAEETDQPAAQEQQWFAVTLASLPEGPASFFARPEQPPSTASLAHGGVLAEQSAAWTAQEDSQTIEAEPAARLRAEQAQQHAARARGQAEQELKRRSSPQAGQKGKAAQQAPAPQVTQPEAAAARDDIPTFDRWNVERFGLRTIATTDNRGVSGYNPDPALDYCTMTGNFGFGGTSAAAAQVAGVVALMLTARPALKKRAKAVKDILCATAAGASKPFLEPEPRRGHAFRENERQERFEVEFGAGLVDAKAAVAAAERWTPPR